MKTQHKRLHDEATQRTTSPRFTVEELRRLVSSPTLKNAGTTTLNSWGFDGREDDSYD